MSGSLNNNAWDKKGVGVYLVVLRVSKKDSKTIRELCVISRHF